MILALGTIITALLVAATGEASARPALSIFVSQSNQATKCTPAWSHKFLSPLGGDGSGCWPLKARTGFIQRSGILGVWFIGRR